MDILAYTAELNGKAVTFTCNDGRTLTTDKYMDAITYLLEPCHYAVVNHIDKFYQIFSSLLPSKSQSDIEANERTVLTNGEKIFYSTGRQLSIGYGWRNNQRNEVNIYGLHRYTDNYIPEPKALYELWREVVKAYDTFGIVPTSLPSPVGVYEPLLDKIDFARACDLPHNADEMISKCADVAWEEWRETYKLGHWNKGEVTDLDISSSYPSQIAKLPDLHGARFYTSHTMPDKFSFGLLEGTVTINKDVTPFLNTGTYKTTITSGRLRQIRQYHWGDFFLETGYFIDIPCYKKPFAEIMNQFYQAKQSDNPIVKKIAKAISVGIGGKFNSRYGNKVGRNYNPIYAKMITSGCQCQVADMIWGAGLQERTISVTVDGVLFEGSPNNVQCNSGMGEWRVEPQSPFLVLSMLYEWGNSKRPDGHTYPEIMDIIQKNPNQSVYGDIDFNLIERDRDFPVLPKNGGELVRNRYTSRSRMK